MGTNACAKENDFVAGASTDTYCQIITTAKEKVQDVSKVKAVSIPPRSDNTSNQERVASLNASLCALAQQTGAKFINNDPAFLLQDGSPNDGYLHQDGVHLNLNGTNRLAKNMGLLAKNQCKGNVCKDTNTYTRPRNDWPQVRPGNYTKGRLLMVTDSLAEMQQMDDPNKSVGTVGNLIIIPPTVDMVIPSSATSVTCWATKQNSVVGIRGMAKKRVPIMN